MRARRSPQAARRSPRPGRCAEDRGQSDRVASSRLAVAAEKIESRGADWDSSCSLEIRGKRLGCGGRELNGDNAGKALRELAGEEADAGEEVPGERTAVARCNAFDESIHQPAVHLEKCAMVYAIVEAGGAIGRGRLRPIARRCAAVGRLGLRLPTPHREVPEIRS